MSQRVHSQPELSVVVAVGDQEDSIGHLIRNVASHLSSLGRSFEILVVNAGCKDADIAHLKSHIGGRCEVLPLPDRALLALQGPKAAPPRPDELGGSGKIARYDGVW